MTPTPRGQITYNLNGHTPLIILMVTLYLSFISESGS